MYAPGKTLSYKRKLAWQILFCLTILAFLCRAVVPAGYMPATAAESPGLFAVTLCSSSGVSFVSLDLGDDAQQGSSPQYPLFENCPFGLTLAQKLVPGTDPVTGVTNGAFQALVLPAAIVPTLRSPLPGPPLGSRAPPAGSLHALPA